MNIIKHFKNTFTTSAGRSESKKKVCIVGAGPAGFYAAQHLIKNLPDCYVDIVEKLPVPFGLVRLEKLKSCWINHRLPIRIVQ